MRLSNMTGVVLYLLLIIGCNSDNNPDDPNGGWYLISDKKEVLGEVIFNKYDVDEIWIESSKNAYNVTGRFTPDAIVRLGTFTEQNIGKILGFVLDGEIITYPVIEQKNEEGRFSIVCTKKSKAQRVYESLLIGKLNL